MTISKPSFRATLDELNPKGTRLYFHDFLFITKAVNFFDFSFRGICQKDFFTCMFEIYFTFWHLCRISSMPSYTLWFGTNREFISRAFTQILVPPPLVFEITVGFMKGELDGLIIPSLYILLISFSTRCKYGCGMRQFFTWKRVSSVSLNSCS